MANQGRPTAEVIAEYAAKYPEYRLDIPLGYSYPNHAPVAGVFDPNSGPIDFTNRITAGPGYIKRYGHGMAHPVLQDLSALPAITIIPDAEHNLWATKGEEGQEFPNDQTLLILNMTDPSLPGINHLDYQFLWNFSEYVIGPINRGLPIGTPRKNWPQPVNEFVPFPPTTVKTPLDPPQPNSTVVANASIDIPSLISQTLNQLLPALITAEIARALPKQTITGPAPIPAVVVAPPVQQNSTSVAVLAQISDLINNLAFPTGNAGGAAWVALRKIRKLLPQ